MPIRIMSANLAGGSRYANVSKLVEGYVCLFRACKPQIILLQEAAREISECAYAGAVMRKLVAGTGEGEVRERVMADPKIREYTAGKEIRKTVYVPGKLFSIVVS